MPRPNRQKGIAPTSCFFVSLVDFTSYRCNILNRVQNVTGFALDFGVWFIYIVFTFRLFRRFPFFLLCLYL